MASSASDANNSARSLNWFWHDLSHLFFGTALPGIIDADGGGLAHLAGRKSISRVDAYGHSRAERLLADLVIGIVRVHTAAADDPVVAVHHAERESGPIPDRRQRRAELPGRPDQVEMQLVRLEREHPLECVVTVEAGERLAQTLVWVKQTPVLGHSDYHYRHEPILYGYAPEHAASTRPTPESANRSRSRSRARSPRVA